VLRLWLARCFSALGSLCDLGQGRIAITTVQI
jgi:hypothetical protein